MISVLTMIGGLNVTLTIHVMFPHPLSLRRQPALQRFMSCSPIHCHCADNQHCNASCHVPPSTVIAQTTSIATLHVMFPHPLSLRRQPALQRFMSCSPIHCHCAHYQHCNASCHVPPSTVIAQTTSIASCIVACTVHCTAMFATQGCYVTFNSVSIIRWNNQSAKVTLWF